MVSVAIRAREAFGEKFNLPDGDDPLPPPVITPNGLLDDMYNLFDQAERPAVVPTDPLALDLNGDGVRFSAANDNFLSRQLRAAS